MNLQKFTPILVVETVESCLPFWETQLNYSVEASIPHEDKIGFVILKNGDSELMLQSKTSLAADLPVIQDKSILLYARVHSLDQIEASLAGAEIIVPRRKTFYGALEIWVKEPSGAILGFAEFQH